MSRTSLPARRREITAAISHHEPGVQDHKFLLSIGYYDATGERADEAGEVFASGHREGSTMQLIMADASILISLLLQHGASPEAIAKTLGRVPKGEDETTPATFIGTIMEAVIASPTYQKAAEVA